MATEIIKVGSKLYPKTLAGFKSCVADNTYTGGSIPQAEADAATFMMCTPILPTGVHPELTPPTLYSVNSGTAASTETSTGLTTTGSSTTGTSTGLTTTGSSTTGTSTGLTTTGSSTDWLSQNKTIVMIAVGLIIYFMFIGRKK